MRAGKQGGRESLPAAKMSLDLKVIAMRDTAGAETRPPESMPRLTSRTPGPLGSAYRVVA
jgi:hypothetical protein